MKRKQFTRTGKSNNARFSRTAFKTKRSNIKRKLTRGGYCK